MVSQALPFALLGIVTGGLSAAGVALLLHVPGDVVGMPVLLCLPGLAFGVVFGGLLARRGLLSPIGAVGWAIAATLGNAAAVLCVISVVEPLKALFGVGETTALLLGGVP